MERGKPPAFHGAVAFFLDAPQPGELGADGHPKRGGSMPPISLPRRMAGASETTFHRELTVDQPVTRKTAFSDITHKKGRSGDLVFVQTTTEIEQGGELCSTSKYTSIFRGEADLSAPSPQVEQPSPPEPRPGDEVWEPGPVDLFRYAAVTFNSHRIHYDLPYGHWRGRVSRPARAGALHGGEAAWLCAADVW